MFACKYCGLSQSLSSKGSQARRRSCFKNNGRSSYESSIQSTVARNKQKLPHLQKIQNPCQQQARCARRRVVRTPTRTAEMLHRGSGSPCWVGWEAGGGQRVGGGAAPASAPAYPPRSPHSPAGRGGMGVRRQDDAGAGAGAAAGAGLHRPRRRGGGAGRAADRGAGGGARLAKSTVAGKKHVCERTHG